MSKTYAEMEQRVLFTAAAETYDIASLVLNDCIDPAMFTGPNYEWSRDRAKMYADRAWKLREQALEVAGVFDAWTAVKINRAKRRYSEAVERHLRLRKEYSDGQQA